MTEYAILLPLDPSVQASATPEQQADMGMRHLKFAELLAARGHQITGGNELQGSATARTVTGSLDQITVTDGPYAEAAEHVAGFYTVQTEDLDDLLKICGLLAEGGHRVEVRATVDHSGGL